MINGFKEETAPLSEYEMKTILPRMLAGLKKRVGKQNAITNKQIVKILKKEYLTINDARVRKIINHIRQNDIIPLLIATSRGYYIEYNHIEVKKYIESLHQRATSIYAIEAAMTRQYKEQFNNQENLF